MGTVIVLLLIGVVIIGALWWGRQQKAARQQHELGDAQAEARRWVERLGGQVFNLDGATEPAAKQALADASERYTAAGSQLEQARTAIQCRLATQTAMEGLYYIRAARTAMGLDLGPELPDLSGQRDAGSVSEQREVDVEGHSYTASPQPTDETPHYYPGGMVAGRPVPEGWYSEPWWKSALKAGAWGAGGFLLADALFSGMHGVSTAGWDQGHTADFAGGGWPGDSFGDYQNVDYGNDVGGNDFGGGDFSDVF